MSAPTPAVKAPNLAGRWYPAEPEVLERTVRGMLAAGGSPKAGVIALLAPHAAYRYSGPTAARAFASVVGAGYERVVLLAPSHFAAFRGAAILPMRGYQTPLGVVPLDEDGAGRLLGSPLVRRNPAAFMREHAVEIQLPWLQILLPGCRVLPLLVGSLEEGDAAALAAAVRALLGPHTLAVVSSDLIHYGRSFDYQPVPPTDAATVTAAVRRLDEGALDAIVACDAERFARYVDETGATICGRNPIELLLRALPPAARGERIAYGTSLDLTGDFEHTVSYAAVAFAAAAA